MRHFIKRFVLSSPSKSQHVALLVSLRARNTRKVVNHHRWIIVWLSTLPGMVDEMSECRKWQASVNANIQVDNIHACLVVTAWGAPGDPEPLNMGLNSQRAGSSLDQITQNHLTHLCSERFECISTIFRSRSYFSGKSTKASVLLDFSQNI